MKKHFNWAASGFWLVTLSAAGACVGSALAATQDASIAPAAIVGGCVGLVIACWVSWSSAVNSAAEEARQRETVERRKGDEERQQRWERDREIADLKKLLLKQAEMAVDAFADLPRYLAGSKGWAERAVTCYRDGAFSPFWSALESAYDQLGGYRATLEKIERHSREHARLLTVIRSKDGAVGEIAAFPVTLDTAHVQQTLDAATNNLNDLAYQAQREPTFAIIWEQRRSTNAVITGFANLESAVNGMRAAVSSSLSSLEQALREGTTQTERSLSGLSRSVTTSLEAAHTAEIATLRDIAHRSDQIQLELRHQNWGRYSLLG